MTDVERTISRLLAAHCGGEALSRAEAGECSDELWRALIDIGVLGALVDVGDHRFGASPTDAFDVIRLAGKHALPAPLPETMLANWLLARCGLAILDGPTVIVADASMQLVEAGKAQLVGSAKSVPWGRSAAILALVEWRSAWWVTRLEPGAIEVTASQNIALEPRDHLRFKTAVSFDCLARTPEGVDVSFIRAAGAALRCAQMAGAIERVMEMSIDYAASRVQFGKPIAKFQAIQQSLAVLAEQSTAARVAADLAVEAFSSGVDRAGIAAAKIFVSEAAGVAAGIAHQIHGATGFTSEYPLHFFTKRLWSWREEYGNETEWAAWLGARLSEAGPERLWAELTAI